MLGFNGVRTNHQRLKDGKDVVSKKLVETFVNLTLWLGFQGIKCCDPQFKTKVEKKFAFMLWKSWNAIFKFDCKKNCVGDYNTKVG